MKTNSDSFYLEQTEPNQSCLLALKKLILDLDPDISPTVKWSLPCFVYKNKMLCFLSVDKKSKNPYILVVEGAKIDHPALEQGDRKRMKILPIDPNKDLPLEVIHNILSRALELYK